MALEKITKITGTGVYLPGDDIDTDRIIPARYLRCVTFDDLAEGLFYDARFTEGSTPKPHPLNDPRFKGATIMVSDSNFGCGSSREHAPQAIRRAGFRAIIAQSFAEIFFGNAMTLGMPCLAATAEQIQSIAAAVEADPKVEITIDVENETVTVSGETYQVTVRPAAKSALTAGRWDPIGELLEAGERIDQTAARLPYLQTNSGVGAD
jgi:3-isopropylmalate/(R)-2-methylmalate dehydratase small subunit